MGRAALLVLCSFLTLCALTALSGCNRQQAAQPGEAATTGAPRARVMQDTGAHKAVAPASAPAQSAPESRRYLALSHIITLEVGAESMQQIVDQLTQRARQMGGEIEVASFSRESRFAPPTASLGLRLPPAKVAEFLSGMASQGVVLQHEQQSEDKTAQVIDVDAQLRNLTDLRDRLRTMLAARNGAIKDVLEVERTLADTQARLDAMSGQRKALANLTDMVALRLQFKAAVAASESGLFAPIAAAWSSAGTTLMSSFGTLITFGATILPWLVLALPALWLFRRWRRYIASRSRSMP